MNMILVARCLTHLIMTSVRRVQGSSTESFLGLENYIAADSYHFCHNLPATFLLPGKTLLATPSTTYALLR